MNWYYVDQGQQAGPVDDAQLAQLVRGGKIERSTLVWHDGMANWVPYSEVQSSPAPPATSPPPVQPAGNAAAPAAEVPTTEAVCTECGKIFASDQMIRFGTSTAGMPPPVVYRGSDGELMIYDGVTRATRVAKLLPGTTVHVEVMRTLTRPVGQLPTIGERLP